MSTKELHQEVDRLTKEVRRLRAALAPHENPELTAKVVTGLQDPATRRELHETHTSNGVVMISAKDMWMELFATMPNKRDVASMGQSLLALGWTRTVRQGWPIFKVREDDLWT